MTSPAFLVVFALQDNHWWNCLSTTTDSLNNSNKLPVTDTSDVRLSVGSLGDDLFVSSHSHLKARLVHVPAVTRLDTFSKVRCIKVTIPC